MDVTALATPDDEPEDDYAEREPETTVDIGRADWHAKHLQAFASQAEEITRTADAEIRRWTLWREDQLERIGRRSLWHRMTLQAFHSAWYARTQQGTFSLPCSVTLRRRTQQPEYRRDEAVLAAWATEHGYVRVKTTESVDWARLKAEGHRGPGGLYIGDQLVPGVTVVDRAPEFSVEVGGE